MKITKSLQKVWSYVPKRVAAAFALVAVVAVPMAIYAWGPSRPTYTIKNPADHVTFDSIIDNPNYGDERNFLRVRDADKANWPSTSTNGWTDTIENMQEGHTYDVKMYVHNNAASNLNLVAENVRAHINLPVKEDTFGKQFEINGYLSADNATPNEIWDNIVLKSQKAFHVKVVSQKYYNNLQTEDKGGYDLPDEVYTAKGTGTGALLGYDKMDGKIPGCFQYAGFVILKIQPVFQIVPAPAYDVEKSVDKTTANPGDTINYTINVKNTGNINLTNVKVTDKLPEYYSNASEKIEASGKISGSIVKNGVVTFDQLKVGETAKIHISYTVKGKDQLECGITKITNKATGTTDQDQTEDNDGNNEVNTDVNKDCTPPPVEKKPGYDVEKAVDKSTAKPGDTIKYTITATNTGEVDLTNVKIADKLPAYYSDVKEEVQAPSATTGSIVKNGEVTIAKLPVGGKTTITITYKVKDAKDLVCGETKITNKATGTTDQDQTEDRDDNNQVETTVNRECNPGYDIEKTVDKTTAKPGDTITYKIVAKNTGEVDLTNVKVADKLPAYYSEASEKVDAPGATTGSIVKNGEITIAKLPVGKSATVTITYKVKAAKDLQCGITKITNKATGTTDQDQTEDNDGNNEVNTNVNRDCQPGYDLTKTVDKTTAKPGETLTYKLVVRNTGEVDLTNVKIADKLPEYYSEASEKVDAPSAITGSIVKNGEITIAKLPVGKSATVTITYKVKDVKNLVCGETHIVNKATSTTDQDKTEDNNQNNQTTTTVTRECKYSYDLAKTVDKKTAKPGDKLTYTLVFKNTGEKDLTNVVVTDKLPNNLTFDGKFTAEPNDGVTGSLKDGIKIAKVAAGKTVKLTFTATVAAADKFQCGETTLTNTASSTSKEDQKESDANNNSASTTVSKECTPETPPAEIPPTTTPPTTTEKKVETPTPAQPTTIAATGADAVASVVALGAISAAATAYIRSRKAVKNL